MQSLFDLGTTVFAGAQQNRLQANKDHVKKMLDDFFLIMTNFEIRVEITENLQRMNDGPVIVFIRKDSQITLALEKNILVLLNPIWN